MADATRPDGSVVPGLASLHAECVARGLADDSDHGLLMFVAAAEAALRTGKSPQALFAQMVNRGDVRGSGSLWITIHDEEAAHRRIKRWQGLSAVRPVPRAENSRTGPCAEQKRTVPDAEYVRRARAGVRAAGHRLDDLQLFAAVSRQYADWPRDRWDRAVEELDGGTRR
jgi:hypothetical protein